jgi:hypothetical protein
MQKTPTIREEFASRMAGGSKIAFARVAPMDLIGQVCKKNGTKKNRKRCSQDDIEEFASCMAERSTIAFTRVAPIEPLNDKPVSSMAPKKIESVAAMRGALIKLRREEFVGGIAHSCQCALAAMMDVPTMPLHVELIVGMV